MKTTNKFYLISFLKNQTFFTPILIIFLQVQTLSLQEIFWVFTIGSTISFLIEIPTGVIADLFGKRKSIILSKALITLSFIAFGFSSGFWAFVAANVLLEIGKSFRSGTEAAYIYDYLDQNPDEPNYTEVKGKQKFWARLGEAEATALGGIIAATFGYAWAFFAAALPALAGVLITITLPRIKEHNNTISMTNSLALAKTSICELCKRAGLARIVLNITIFASIVAAVEKLVQPYMQQVGIPVEAFGFIYAGSLIITALAVRYSYLVENKLGRLKTINLISYLAIIPALILGFGFRSWWGVLLFFIFIIFQNIRSPVIMTEFHSHVESKRRSTMGSILEQAKNAGSMIILPIIGWLASDSIGTAMIVASIILAAVALTLNITKSQHPQRQKRQHI